MIGEWEKTANMSNNHNSNDDSKNYDPIAKNNLTQQQYEVTQLCSTEPPFQNAYWDHFEDGIYVDVVSGQPLFCSLDKFKSGTGWPSFSKPIHRDFIMYFEDRSRGMIRTEVKSAKAGSHLGHVFENEPGVYDRRYCINSASLKFVPLSELKQLGYKNELWLFEEKKKWRRIVLGGGCFWGMEHLLARQDGVLATRVGYAGGKTQNPTYTEVKKGTTGHAEVVDVLYDPTKTSLVNLLKYFFTIHDPTTIDRQGNDIGSQYRSVIFLTSKEEEETAWEVLSRVLKSGAWGDKIATEIVKGYDFYLAEEYHQEYLVKNPGGYTCHFERKIEYF